MRRARLAILALTLLVAGCANLLAEREARLRKLVGQKLDVLIATEGVPDRSFVDRDITYLAYIHQHVDLIPGQPPFGPAWGPWGGPLGWYAAPPPTAVMRGCETVFAVKAGVVTGFTLRGNDCG
ncbi:MAG: hypothetical protein KGI51_03530 [Rhodospirillales bacterium]|nr:hypothetical protein [Rhodospirillales bacterium]